MAKRKQSDRRVLELTLRDLRELTRAKTYGGLTLLKDSVFDRAIRRIERQLEGK